MNFQEIKFMDDKNKILVGKIVAPQGIRGEVRVQTYTNSPNDLKDMAVESARFGPKDFTFVRLLNPTSSVMVARIAGINNRTAAETLRGTELFISRDTLPSLGPDEYYQADLIGFTVIRNGQKFGTVAGFQNFGAGDIVELENGDLLSFSGADVDLVNKVIKL